MQQNPILWWANLFLLFFLAAWLIRGVILPYFVSQRIGRPFKYGRIHLEERQSFTTKEKQLLFLVKIFGYSGFIVFICTAAFIFKFAFENRVHQ